MKSRYTLEITIYHSSLEKPLSIEIKDTDLLSLKADIKPTIELMCYEKGIKGTVDIEILIDKNGEYFDSDEFELDVN